MVTMQALNRCLTAEQKKEFVAHIGTNSPAYLFSHVGIHRRPGHGLANRIEDACRFFRGEKGWSIPLVTAEGLFEHYDAHHPKKSNKR